MSESGEAYAVAVSSGRAFGPEILMLESKANENPRDCDFVNARYPLGAGVRRQPHWVVKMTGAEKEAAVKEAYVSAAKVFEMYASDQIASKRFQSSAREKRDCDVRAGIWNDAASELRRAVAG